MEQHNEQLLLSEIRNLSAAIEKLYKRQSIWFNFMSGVIHSVGYFVGIVLLVVIVAYFLQNVPLIPIIGNWLGEVFKEALSNITPAQYMQLLK